MKEMARVSERWIKGNGKKSRNERESPRSKKNDQKYKTKSEGKLVRRSLHFYSSSSSTFLYLIFFPTSSSSLPLVPFLLSSPSTFLRHRILPGEGGGQEGGGRKEEVMNVVLAQCQD